MSHANITYPQSTRHGPTLFHPWQIREDGDDYTTDSEGDNTPADTLLALTDRQSAEQPPEQALKVTAMLLLDLIQEAREANEKVWEQIRRLTRKET